MSQENAIPLNAVNADQLQTEKGWTYDEIAQVVGSLYLDSHHSIRAREQQFRAVSEGYQRQILKLQGDVKVQLEEIERLNEEISNLKQELDAERETVANLSHELEISNADRDITQPSING